jgi:hypothetical protein
LKIFTFFIGIFLFGKNIYFQAFAKHQQMGGDVVIHIFLKMKIYGLKESQVLTGEIFLLTLK